MTSAVPERSGWITFINSHDYYSDVLQKEYKGCLASVDHDAGTTLLYTTSERLQHTLEMAFATKVRVTVDFVATELDRNTLNETLRSVADMIAGAADGPFTLKAIWTLTRF
jgi:hypothetical protein